MLDQPFRVWIVGNDRVIEEAEFSILDQEEQRQSLRLRAEEDRRAFVTTRVVLRKILSDIVCVPPREIEFRKSPWGRLELKVDTADGLDFSVSHTRGLSVVALSQGRRVGVDVEHDRVFADKSRIAADVFGCDAARQLSEVDEVLQNQLFLQMWTAGEALLKAQGTGFAGTNGKVPVCLSRSGRWPHAILDNRQLATKGWTLSRLSLPSGFVGHVVFGGLPPEQDAPHHRDQLPAPFVYTLS